MKLIGTFRSLLACGAVIGSFLVGAAAPASAQSWDQVVAGAKKEGKLVWYHNQNAQGAEPLLQKFREAYPGIETEAVRVTSNAMMERFVTEYNAGRHLADVVITFSDERVLEGLSKGWMAQWTPPELPNFPPTVNQDNRLFTISQAREALVWNKNLVRDADAPKEWADLFDPKWKGKVGINPPWRALPILQIVAFWESQGLGDVAEKLKANNVRFFEGSGGIMQAIIRGDVHVAEVTDSTLNPLLRDGAPFGVRYPDSGTTTSSSVTFVAEKAPHPNAARVFVNWMMSQKGQEHTQEYLALPVTRNGMPPMSHLPATSQLKNVVDGTKILTPERRDAIVTHWQKTFGIR